jgi:2-keto-4-pentenoate hydratase/2-oxohepta-3-ene-1,7-dioic acid hydratase in catechol pathway
VRQSHSTSDRLFEPEQIVSWLSHMGTLNPGDVISCGSPPGMTWMKHGDVCEVEIEGIGVLRNHVRDRA